MIMGRTQNEATIIEVSRDGRKWVAAKDVPAGMWGAYLHTRIKEDDR